MEQKTCFVISPISTKDSDVRKEADILLWAIKQAAIKYGLKVVRIDEIAKTHEITKEIVRYVKDSSLCVIVLTGNNPNVYYEAGLRHATGLPYIHLVREGERLPFDVAAINSIQYGDIKTIEATQELVENIDKFIAAMRDEIDGKAKQAVTLDAIADAISRMEKKLDRPLRSNSPGVQLEDPTMAMKNPREAFVMAIAKGDVDTATAMLSRLENVLGRTKEHLHASLICAQAGAMEGVNYALQYLDDRPDWMSIDDVIEVVGVLSNYYSMRDEENEGIAKLFPVLDGLEDLPAMSTYQRAMSLNQRQRLLYGAMRYEDALEMAERVLELEPASAAYLYNASLIYEKLGLMNKSREMIDRLMQVNELEDSHLAQAVEIYVGVNETEKAKAALLRLRAEYPERAAVVLLNKKFRDLL